ncbi:MAG: response regulator [Nitrospiraceae bacterium]|nr:response regulator [Nitrospiraceae bacterium]
MRLRFKSLRIRLVFWFLTVTMLSLTAVVTILYFQRAATLRGMEFERLQVVRDLKVRELTNWLDERMSDLQVSSRDEEIRGLEGVLGKPKSEWSPENLKAVSIARSLLQRYVDRYGAYSEFFVIGAASGKIEICSESAHEGQDERMDLYFTEPMRTRKPYIKDIYLSKTEDKPSMAFSSPIFCLKRDGEHIIGVLVARANLEHVLYPLIQERTGMGESGETLIVNKDGFAVNELRWAENAPLKLKIAAEPAVKAADGETGIVETKDYRGEMVLAAYTHIPLTQWGFVVKRDLAEVHAPIRAILRDMVLIIAVAALIVVLVSMLLAGTITRPILSIGEVVGRFAEGDLEARWLPEGPDEVAALGTSFNEMAGTLASQIAIRQGSAGISETMVAAGDVEDFASGLLMRLIDISGSHLGAFYMRSENGEMFEQTASVGLSGGAAQFFSAEEHEGELGKTLATGRISHIRHIPADTVFTFKTTGGTAIPREIITIPLGLGRKVMAVVSLATLGSYSDSFRQIIEQARLGMDTAFSNLLTGAKTERLAEALRASNEEMTLVNEELQEQAEEMQAQAEELEVQRLQVVEANRLKSEFVSNMSHELRTPLNSVMALSQLMLSRGIGSKPEDDAEHLRVIERNARRLLSLINDILDLSKIEAGWVELSLCDFDPRDLVERTLGTVQPMADEQRLRLEANFTEVPRMYSDEERIGQILLNLLSNAVKFTEQGQISVDVRAAGGMVAFAVTDTGIGISEIDLPHIFEEFRQVDGSTTRRYEGTGLGLAICQRIARPIGGAITVESALGEGSTFTLRLPARCPAALLEDDAASSLGRVGEEKPGPGRRRPRGPAREKPLVLVVEDNEVAALQVRSALEESGYRVTVAEGGAAGLSAVREEIPDAIILDLMMPEVDGFQVLEEIRSDSRTADVPVLVLTAKELIAEDRARLTRNNIRELLQKGDVGRDELLACVAAMLEEPAEPGPAPRPTASITREPPSPASERSKTVLIVEDNLDNLLTISAILDNIGCQYISAQDGGQAVRAAKESRPGLILMDIQLPVVSGIEATRRIKADPELKGTPIVALTAKAMKGDREEILAAGCDDYLCKPLDAVTLTGIVRKWLGLEEKTS